MAKQRFGGVRGLCLGVAAAALIGVSLVAGATPAAAQEKKITVLLWGTTWQALVQKSADDFTKKTGIKVEAITQTTGGEGLVKLQAMKAKPTVDVWYTTASVAERAVPDSDLFVDLPVAKISNWKDIPDDAKKPRWVAAYYYPVGIVYRPDLVNPPITKWEDLWDKRFANKLGLPAPSSYQGRMIMIATLIGGGSIDNVEPGFEKLKVLKDNVAFYYTSDAQARQALAQGEVSVLVGPPTAARAVRDQGAQATMISPKPTPTMYDVMTMVKGGKEDMAAQFIDFMLSTEIQQRTGDIMQMGPVNKNAVIPDILKGALPKPGDEVAFDEDKINRNIGAWTERFNQTVAK